MTRDDNRNTFDQPRQDGSATWVAAAVAVLILLGIGVWAFSGNVDPTQTASSPALTGQATSKTGSTNVGAPPGTPPKETTGQATTPSGTNTTGGQPKR